MTPEHRRLAELVNLLPDSRQEVAAILSVSLPTLHGWLRAARQPIGKRAPGYAPPAPEVVAKVTKLLEQHVADCQATLAGTRDLDDGLGYVGPFLHGPELDGGEDTP